MKSTNHNRYSFKAWTMVSSTHRSKKNWHQCFTYCPYQCFTYCHKLAILDAQVNRIQFRSIFWIQLWRLCQFTNHQFQEYWDTDMGNIISRILWRVMLSQWHYFISNFDTLFNTLYPFHQLLLRNNWFLARKCRSAILYVFFNLFMLLFFPKLLSRKLEHLLFCFAICIPFRDAVGLQYGPLFSFTRLTWL